MALDRAGSTTLPDTCVQPSTDRDTSPIYVSGLANLSASNPKKCVTVLQPKYYHRAKKNADHLRSEQPALRWMRGRTQPPKHRDQTRLDGGTNLGAFWGHCKSLKRCTKPPYDRLLTIPVLKADYRHSTSATKNMRGSREGQGGSLRILNRT